MLSFVSRRLIHVTTSKYAPVSLTSINFVSPADHNPPLILVHGLFGQKKNWNSVGKSLHRELEASVYAVDVRNHGSSPHTDEMTYTDMAEDLALFVDKVREETGKSKVNVLGHSMGGKTAMRMAIESKWCDRINKLIVEDTSPKGHSKRSSEFCPIIKAMREANLQRSRKEILLDMEKIVPDMPMRQFLLTNLQHSQYQKGFMEWKCNLDTIGKYIDGTISSSLPIGSFNGPTLFVHSETSGYVPDDHVSDIRSRFPQVVFNTIPGAGHSIHSEQPELFIKSIVQFLSI